MNSKDGRQAQWWKLQWDYELDQELQTLLLECGAAGCAVNMMAQDQETYSSCGKMQTSCFFFGLDADLKEFTSIFECHLPAADKISLLEKENWVSKCSELLENVSCGMLVISPYPANGHDQPSNPNAQAIKDAVPISIVAGEGFGTGHHPTTFMCLLLLQCDQLAAVRQKLVLDLGTGSGILSIAAEKLLDCRCLGLDIDFHALRNASYNCAINECSAISLLCSDHRAVCPSHLKGQGFNLVLANLYSELLQTMSKPIQKLISPGGYLLCSGMTCSQFPQVIETFENLGLELVRPAFSNLVLQGNKELIDDSGRADYKGWSACLLRRIE